jgi:1-acyl-sn-glycerol-3-phosphate acyltransferase
MMLALRSLIFAIGMWGATLMAGLLSVFIWVFPYERRYAILNFWARFNIWWLKKTCRLDYQVEGMENVPSSTPVIVLSKHQSTFETIVFQVIFPRQVWVLKKELFWLPFFGWALALMRPIAIDRSKKSNSRTQIVEQGTQALKDGHWVVIFPEGTRVSVGKRGKYGIGGALLAQQSGFPILPIAHNAGYFWKRRGFIKYPGTIRIKIGTLLDSKDKNAKEINRLSEEWIEKTMMTLTP